MFKLRLFYSLILLVILNSAFISRIHAQNIKKTGSVSGQVKDSLDMSNLTEATIAIYMINDSKMIKYLLNDQNGRFRIQELPLDSQMRIVVSYIGFKPYLKNFRLTDSVPNLSFEKIIMIRSNEMLKEVLIQQAPMIMKGDTLEFNPDAFKSRKNAVIGDLIKDLPGFIIWGDGKITVNGKKVSQVLVEGKVFFSGDPVISLGNIPKDIVEKVQVISDKVAVIDKNDTVNQTVTLNISLKEGNKAGFFGKLGYGKGNDDRYQGVATLASISSKTQISAGFAVNNVNMINSSVGDIMSSNTFRSGPSTLGFQQPDYTRLGLNKQNFAGLLYNRDWSSHFKSKSEYNALINNDNIVQTSNQSVQLSNRSITTEAFNTNMTDTRRYQIRNSLEYRDSIFNKFKLNSTLSKYNVRNDAVDSSFTLSSQDNIINRIISKNESITDHDLITVDLEYEHKGRRSPYGKQREDFVVKYGLQEKDAKIDRKNMSLLFSDNVGSSNYDRKYIERSREYAHVGYLEYIGLGQLFFRSSRSDLNFKTYVNYNKSKSDLTVSDTDAELPAATSIDNYLSNTNYFNLLKLRPQLSYYTSFSKFKLGRTVWSIGVNLVTETQIFNQRNKSDKVFRNLNRDYANWTPKASIDYSYRRIGSYNHRFSIGYSSDSDIPSVDQLAPLVDSAQQQQYFFGNSDLKGIYRKDFKIEYQWKQETKNGFDLTIDFNHGIVNNQISDSTYYNELGIRNVFPVNVNGFRQNDLNLILNKAFQFNKSQLTWRLIAEMSDIHMPFYVDNRLVTSVTNSYRFNSLNGMTIRDLIGLRLNYWANFFRTKFDYKPEYFRVADWGSSMQVTVHYPDKVIIANSVAFNRNSINSSNAFHTVIWNAHVSYRFTSTDQLEIKVSANDILNQNQGIRNFVNHNSVGYSNTNRIKRYLMFALSYYPRYFGRKKKSNNL